MFKPINLGFALGIAPQTNLTGIQTGNLKGPNFLQIYMPGT